MAQCRRSPATDSGSPGTSAEEERPQRGALFPRPSPISTWRRSAVTYATQDFSAGAAAKMTMASESDRLSLTAKGSRPWSIRTPVRQDMRSATARNLRVAPYSLTNTNGAADTAPSAEPVDNFARLQPSQQQCMVQSILQALREVSSPVRDARRIPLFYTRPEPAAVPSKLACSESELRLPAEPCVADGDQTASGPSLAQAPRLFPCSRVFHSPYARKEPADQMITLPAKSLDSLQAGADVRLFNRRLRATSGSTLIRDVALSQPLGDKRPYRPSPSGATPEAEVHSLPAVLESGREQEVPRQTGRKRQRSPGEQAEAGRYNGESCLSASDEQRRAKCQRVQPSPGRSAVWMCDTCLVQNSERTTSCFACGLVRPDAVPAPRAELKSDGNDLIRLRQSMPASSMWLSSLASPAAAPAGSYSLAVPGSAVDSKELVNAVQVGDNGGAGLWQTSGAVGLSAAAKPAALHEVPAASSLTASSGSHEVPAVSLPQSTPAGASSSLSTMGGLPKRLLFKFGSDDVQASSTASEAPGTVLLSTGAAVQRDTGQGLQQSTRSQGFSLQPFPSTSLGLFTSLAAPEPAAGTAAIAPLVSSTEARLVPAISSTFSFGSGLQQPAVSQPSSGSTSAATNLRQPSGFSLAALPTSSAAGEKSSLGPPSSVAASFSFGNATTSSAHNASMQPALFGAPITTPAQSGSSAAVKRSSAASTDDFDAPGGKKASLASTLGPPFGGVDAQGQASLFQTAAAPGLGTGPANQLQAVGGAPVGSTSLISPGFGGFGAVPAPSAALASSLPASAGFTFASVPSFNFGSTPASSSGLFRFGAPNAEVAQTGALPAAPAAAGAPFQFGAAVGMAAGAAGGVPAFGSQAESNVFTSGTRVMKKATRRLPRK